ncbi:MAG: DUF3106 domain-containing protein [Verrucomicrobiia bacterium]|jgi:hypothetical protein
MTESTTKSILSSAGLNLLLAFAASICFAAELPVKKESTNATQPPPLPPIQSPIAYFRTLLETNQQAREQILSEKTPEQRKILEAKLNEYLALPQNQRELKLFMTELRWYLTTILRTDSTNRISLLQQVPEKYKPLIQDRLQHWEKLPPDIQKELLENEFALQYALRLTNGSQVQIQTTLSTLHPQQKLKVLQTLANWNHLPEQRRKALAENFNKVFELSQQEQEAALKILPPAERIRMENTLAVFSNLSKEEKERCIASFKRFATMSESEREQFLRNAAKWAEMSPQEREAWRNIVRSFKSNKNIEFPPLPPGLIPEATAMLHSPNINESRH